VQLVYKFLVSSFSYEFLVRETWTVCHRLKVRRYITEALGCGFLYLNVHVLKVFFEQINYYYYYNNNAADAAAD